MNNFDRRFKILEAIEKKETGVALRHIYNLETSRERMMRGIFTIDELETLLLYLVDDYCNKGGNIFSMLRILRAIMDKFTWENITKLGYDDNEKFREHQIKTIVELLECIENKINVIRIYEPFFDLSELVFYFGDELKPFLPEFKDVRNSPKAKRYYNRLMNFFNTYFKYAPRYR